MITLDLVLIAIIAVNALLGLWSGLFSGVLRLVTGALSLAGWYLLGNWLMGVFAGQGWLGAIAAVVLGGLLATVIASLFTRFVGSHFHAWLREHPALSTTNRVLGLVPGLAWGLLLAYMGVAVAGRFTTLDASPFARALLAAGRGPTQALLAAMPAKWPGVALGPGGLVFVPGMGTEPQSQVAPDKLERQMLELVNEERVKAGLGKLKWDGALADVGRAHSRDMLARSYFAHADPEGHTAAYRVSRAGIRYQTVGENLAFAPTLAIAHSGLMHSPGHRANILRPAFGRVGIGIVRLPPGTSYEPRGAEHQAPAAARVAPGSLIVTQVFRD